MGLLGCVDLSDVLAHQVHMSIKLQGVPVHSSAIMPSEYGEKEPI